MALLIRRAEVPDVAALTGLVNRAYRVEEFFMRGDRASAAEVGEALARGVFLIGVDTDGEMVGCVYVELDGARAYVGLLSVEPTRQGEGIGHRLLRAAEQYARTGGCARVDLLVVNLREELFPWYRARGYVEVGTTPFPESERQLRSCHFVRMSRTL